MHSSQKRLSNCWQTNRELGSYGETIAARFLQEKGYRILETNKTSRWGEIDLIAQDGETIVFVEVKTKTTTRHGQPYEMVTWKKRQSLMRAAQGYLVRTKNTDKPCRIDVVSIVLPRTSSFSNTESMLVNDIRHFKNIDISA
ncbi:MAG: YraN family protein [Patescibacteria group bacterium]